MCQHHNKPRLKFIDSTKVYNSNNHQQVGHALRENSTDGGPMLFLVLSNVGYKSAAAIVEAFMCLQFQDKF